MLKLISLFLGACLLVCLSPVLAQDTNFVLDHAIAINVDLSTGNPTKVDNFSSTDHAAHSWIKYINLENSTIRRDWYTPEGNLYLSTSNNISGSGAVWYPLYIDGYKPANMPGIWRVDVYVNDKKVFSDYFTITPAIPAQSGILDHAMASDVNLSTGNPTKADTFSSADYAADSWIKYSNLENSTIRRDWYSPDGKLYYSSSGYISGSNEQWGYLYIAGYPPANETGNWRVDVYVNDKKAFSDYFTITPAIPAESGILDHAMASDVNLSTGNPTKTDNFSSTDYAAYSWIKYSNVENSTIHWKWYSPDGMLYRLTSDYMSGSNEQWGYIYIAGYPPANMSGNWRVST